MSEVSDKPLSYKQAGVDIAAGNRLVERIKPFAKSTTRKEVLGNLGGFGALCALPSGYQEPILVAGTDGVGTKLKFAIDSGQHKTIGIDLVAMCVNDLLVCGAEPLFFLDYYGTGKLDVDVASDVIEGIASGCRQAGCALIGGETAELPGLYQPGDYDLAGFCVGVVEKSKIITGESIEPGDQLIGLASNGVHSNGYSLVRAILERAKLDPNQAFNETTLNDALLTPTRIYVDSIKALQQTVPIKGMAHITGGGLTENLPRVMPESTCAHIQLDSWQVPAILQLLATQGKIDELELLKTFNMGIGMVLAVAPADLNAAMACLQVHGEQCVHIGEIKASDQRTPSVEYHQHLQLEAM